MITVIYHSADFDGIFCREIAHKFMPTAELIGWNFGEQKVKVPPEGQIYIMDLPPECAAIDLTHGDHGNDWNRIVWIDHHKTSIDKWDSGGPRLPGYRIDGVAACRLAWQWFAASRNTGLQVGTLPLKNDFVERKIEEPLAVRLAGEYDIWDHRGDGDLEFQYGLRLIDEGSDFYEALLNTGGVGMKAVEDTIEHGKICQKYASKMDAKWLSESWHIVNWEGLKFLAQNSVQRGSGILDSKDVPETGHDALMLYGFRGNTWTVSLYHAKHRTDLDLSSIAVRYGGGGHRGACGFTCVGIPKFLQPINP